MIFSRVGRTNSSYIMIISISAVLLFLPSIQCFIPSAILLQQQRPSSSNLYQSSSSNTPFTNFKLPNPFTENSERPAPPAAPTLFDRARLLLSCDFSDPSLLDDNFVWISPYAALGSTAISKSDFLAAQAFFNLRQTFPDWDYRAHDFRLDPDDGLTVRCTVRVVGTMRGGLRVRGEAEEIAANGKRMVCPPEAISMTFCPNSKLLLKLTSNICMDRLVGNTDGLCGLLAAASIAGIPPSMFSVLPPVTVIQRWFERTPKRIGEPLSFLAPFPESVMIQLAKGVLAKDNGASDPSLLSDNFEFVGPLVGPVKKDEFVTAFGGFGIKDAFPDLDAQYSNFRVDPFDPYRVWVDVRGSGTDTGGLAGKEPTGRRFVTPPEAVSLTFDDEGICTRLTAGVVMDPTKGNTGGLGGVFGLFYALGNPLPGIVSRSIPDNLARLKKRLLMPITNIDVDDWQLPQTSMPQQQQQQTDPITDTDNDQSKPDNTLLPDTDDDQSKPAKPLLTLPKIDLPSIQLPSPTPPSSPPPDTDNAATKAKQAAQQAKQARQSISDAAAKAQKEQAAANKLQHQQEKAAKKQEQMEAARLKKEQAAKAAAKQRQEKAAAVAKQRQEKKAAIAQAQKDKREAALAAAEAKKQKKITAKKPSAPTETKPKQPASPFDFFKPSLSTSSTAAAANKSSSSPISAKVTAAQQKKDAAKAKLKIANKRIDELNQAAKTSSTAAATPAAPTKLNRSQTIKLFFARESNDDDDDATTTPTAAAAVPKGIPIMKRWKINRIDDSITGFISGSQIFDDGEKVTTSTIVGGDLVKGSIVRTSSGSKYYLD